jgi:membrane protease YdiL (CAAX protease family)
MEIIFIIVLIFVYLDDLKKFIEDFKQNGKDHLKLGLDYWFIGLLIMIASNIVIGTFSPIPLPENEQAVREAIALNPVFMLFATVLIAPVLEEILFRHTLFKIIKNKNLYVIISGLLFGTFHILGIASSIFSWLYVIPYAALGMAFAYTYVKTNNLLTPIAMHAFHNFITVIQLLILM